LNSRLPSAVDNMTIALSKELGPKKIRVNAVDPGMVETEGFRTAGLAGSDFRKTIEAGLARAAVFFALDDSGWVAGQSAIVAGSQTQ
jgi:3-oxoacyl-[acyl-carrier protein] reductase